MDDEINISPEDLQRLSPNEQRELQVFLQSEQQKNQIAKSETLLPGHPMLPFPLFYSFSLPMSTAKNLTTDFHSQQTHTR
jgi:hypothetical protein